MSRAGTRRIFLVGLGRFMMGAAATAIIKPPVLYSFPGEIRIATPEEAHWVYVGNFARNFAGMSVLEVELRKLTRVIRYVEVPGKPFFDLYVRRRTGGILYEG